MRLFLRILAAMSCWLVASILAYVFMMIPIGWPDGGPLGSYSLLLLAILTGCVFPVWLVLFVPLFFGMSDENVFWKLWVSVPVGAGATMGLLGCTILGGMHGAADHVERMIRVTPMVVGTLMFASGTVYKRRWLGRILEIVQMATEGKRVKNPEEY